ncbi:FHA domain-containing protein [Arthrobacter sp. SLBN-122]|uniref:FHA domain-containing protein n=1 Tax=Arthrobacter sp. SLBN-122 TaxID=2768455 RepID=UPI0011505025|nr:FHA domain-containing protein [Arthrobacter sp. SLBN-122]TQJ35893.1 hypothetical protein FBY36_3173 [Arthrobacter sp. SLBN-122]
MTAASYIPGTWLGVVRSRTAVLLGPGSSAELAGALWELLAGRPEPHEVLAAVTSTSGGSLTRIPSFGILDFNVSLRVFLRGDIDLTVEQAGGAMDLDGRDVTTWNERRFVLPGTCRVRIADGGAGSPGHAAEQPELPLGEGVVLLQSLTMAAPSAPAAVGGPAAADAAAVTGTSAAGPAADGPAAEVPAAVIPAAPAAEAEPPADAPPPAVLPETEDVPQTTLLSEATLLSEHGASGETVLGVIDEDPADEHTAGGAVDLPTAGGLDPDATIAPDGIIGVDGENHSDGDNGEIIADGELAGEADAVPELPDAADAAAAGGASTGAGAGSAGEMTTSYDHLWDRTVMRHIEDAAVREEPDADSGHVSRQQRPALPAAEPLPALGAAGEPPLEVSPAGPGTGAEAENGGQSGPGTGPDPSPEERPAVPPRPASTGVLIDSVPWRIGGATPVPAPPPTAGSPAESPSAPVPAPSTPMPAAPGRGPAGPAPGSSHDPGSSPASGSFPATASGAGKEHSTSQEHRAHQKHSTSQEHSSGQGPGAGFGAAFDPDHDGQTVMKSSLPGAVSGQATNAPAVQQDAAGGPLVLARVCAQGHANPPTRAQCSACGGALLPDAVQVARPRLGRMRLSTGELLDLDQSMVIGRQPSVSRVQGGVMPRLVQVASPGGDISRSHLEVRLEGWHVMLCDLKATNGTVLVREGQPPRRLAQNEMAILLDGDIAELGDNISLRFEEIP